LAESKRPVDGLGALAVENVEIKKGLRHFEIYTMHAGDCAIVAELGDVPFPARSRRSRREILPASASRAVLEMARGRGELVILPVAGHLFRRRATRCGRSSASGFRGRSPRPRGRAEKAP
jgi:hypothetical protein